MSRRLHEIDGIRGWAAAAVILYHFCWETLGVKFPQYRATGMSFFQDGPLAVCVFFALSGDALSNGYLRTSSQYTLARLALKRYFRLVGPIFLSCLIAYALLKVGLTFNIEAAHFVERDDWLGGGLKFEANFRAMAKYALMKVFTDTFGSPSYNAFLWPMPIELCGSFFVFGFLIAKGVLRRPFWVAAAIAIYLWILSSYYALFFVGVAFAMLRQDGFFDRLKKSRFSALVYPALIAMAVVDVEVRKIIPNRPDTLLIFIGSAFVFCIYANERLVGFFSSKFSIYLGRISFPLYVSHFAVLVSFTSWAIVELGKRDLLDFQHSLMVVLASIAIAVVLAEIFTRVEKAYLNRLDAATRLILLDPAPSGVPSKMA